jgi:hypothetical protein
MAFRNLRWAASEPLAPAAGASGSFHPTTRHQLSQNGTCRASPQRRSDVGTSATSWAPPSMRDRGHADSCQRGLPDCAPTGGRKACPRRKTTIIPAYAGNQHARVGTNDNAAGIMDSGGVVCRCFTRSGRPDSNRRRPAWEPHRSTGPEAATTRYFNGLRPAHRGCGTVGPFAKTELVDSRWTLRHPQPAGSSNSGSPPVPLKA